MFKLRVSNPKSQLKGNEPRLINNLSLKKIFYSKVNFNVSIIPGFSQGASPITGKTSTGFLLK